MKHWLGAVFMAVNQLVNALIGGDPGMSVSARAALARDGGHAGGRLACQVLDVMQPLRDPLPVVGDHCTIALRHYRERMERDGHR